MDYKKLLVIIFALASALLTLKCSTNENPEGTQKEITILNVSYDPTREMYQEINSEFITEWKNKTGQTIKINQSHGGSGKQARSVIDGLEADVVTLALAYDIDVISEKAHLLPADWQKRLPQNSSPYTSTFVFLVRKGNPKNIKDWDDLIRPGISVITPNPKTSGAARWNYLAAWVYASEKYNKDESMINKFMSAFIKNVPVFDSGARGATNTFVQRNMGDVLIGWENEAMLVANTFGKGEYEIIIPSVSLLAEPPVAVVDKVVDKKNTREAAEAYLKFLYTNKAQEIIARHFFRPVNEQVLKKYSSVFPEVRLYDINYFGGWKNAQKTHFEDGGTFDQLYTR